MAGAGLYNRTHGELSHANLTARRPLKAPWVLSTAQIFVRGPLDFLWIVKQMLQVIALIAEHVPRSKAAAQFGVVADHAVNQRGGR